jgi:hypothetical protein
MILLNYTRIIRYYTGNFRARLRQRQLETYSFWRLPQQLGEQEGLCEAEVERASSS